MPKRSRSEDANQTAYRVVQESTRDRGAPSRFVATDIEIEPPSAPPKKKRKNPAAVALGRKGGLKGGHARAAGMTPEERSESARKAAETRWQSKRK